MPNLLPAIPRILGEILLFERHLDERIARVGIESGRDQKQIGLEPQQLLQRALGNIDMFLPGVPGATG